MRRRLFATLLTAVAAVVAVGIVVAAELFDGSEKEKAPVVVADAPLLVFESRADGDGEIYTIRADGRRLLRLTDNDADDSAPVWSPDGTRIAFVSDRDGDAEVYVMDADGGGVRQLTRNGADGGRPAPWDNAPSWSPDGSRIAYASRRDGQREIWVMRSEGGGAQRLTRREVGWHENFAPEWSPDGSSIAFVSNREGFFNLELYAMAPDGRGLRRLTVTPSRIGDESMPSWSPDGRRIVFVSNTDGNNELYVMNADGSARKRLTRRPKFADLEPRWSPDGLSIAFRATSPREPDAIYLMRTDGTRLRRLAFGSSPDWRPA